jgi:hypothetical protein
MKSIFLWHNRSLRRKNTQKPSELREVFNPKSNGEKIYQAQYELGESYYQTKIY